MVSLEAEDLQLVVIMEIDVELASIAQETATVEVVPHRLQEMDVPHLFGMVFNDRLEIPVKGEERHGVEVGEGAGDDGGTFCGREGVFVEYLFVSLLVFVEGDEEHGGVDEECGTSDRFAEHLHGFEGVAEVGGDGDAALRDVSVKSDAGAVFLLWECKGQRVVAGTQDHSVKHKCVVLPVPRIVVRTIRVAYLQPGKLTVGVGLLRKVSDAGLV